MNMKYWLNGNLPTSRERSYGIDAIRFIAAFMVMLYHFTASGIGNTMHPERYNLVATTELINGLSNFTVFGFLGVNLFFLISGYIIFSSAVGKSAIEFAVLRAVRLYPVYWLSIIFTLCILLFFLGDGLQLSVVEIVSNLTMVQSYLGAQNLDPVYWTLLVELHFYAIIFIVLIFGSLKTWRLWVTVWLILSIIYYFFSQPFFLPWIVSPEYSGYFIAGIVMCSWQNNKPDAWSVIMVLAAFGLVCLYIPEQIATYNFGTSSTTQNIVGCIIIAIEFTCLALIALKLVTVSYNKTVLTLGSLTYPLYLIHHQFGRYLIDTWIDSVPGVILLIIVISISIAVAWIFMSIGDKIIGMKLKNTYFYLSNKYQNHSAKGSSWKT